MIGLWSAHASTFLRVTAFATAVLFGLPMLAAPLRWARWFRWTIPEHTDLVVYFGRCLGALVVVLGVGALYAASDPALTRLYVLLVFGAATMMTVVHVWGAVRRAQPASETWEIPFWIALGVVSLLFLPD